MNSRQSLVLFNLSRMFPGVPVWPGPLVEWPSWWIEDYKILLRAETEGRKKKKRQQEEKDKEKEGLRKAEELRLRLRKQAIGE